jgi:hypothetical protein
MNVKLIDIIVSIYNLRQKIPIEIIREHILPIVPVLYCNVCDKIIQTFTTLENPKQKYKKGIAWTLSFTKIPLKSNIKCLDCYTRDNYRYNSSMLDRRFKCK